MINPDFWVRQRVFLTGSTGFKGSWTSLILSMMGSKVFGYALQPEDKNSIFNTAYVGETIEQKIADIRDFSALHNALDYVQPTVVIHMAAQALVRTSYISPVETYATNVMGTVHLLEAVRRVPSINAVIIVTSDKCYENKEWLWGYREVDSLGGYDPYSSSKACAELVSAAYRNSFFNKNSSIPIATARAGNVIGGGDWSINRLVPDAVRAFMTGNPLITRMPDAIRPWQHVIDPILGYLLLAEKLVLRGREYADAWNFGPNHNSEVSVGELLTLMAKEWGESAGWIKEGDDNFHEASFLKLDCSKAHSVLKWHPLLDLNEAICLTIKWYREFQRQENMRSVTMSQIEHVISK